MNEWDIQDLEYIEYINCYELSDQLTDVTITGRRDGQLYENNTHIKITVIVI